MNLPQSLIDEVMASDKKVQMATRIAELSSQGVGIHGEPNGAFYLVSKEFFTTISPVKRAWSTYKHHFK